MTFSRFIPIAKIDRVKREVYGYASTEALDSQGEIIRCDALEAALPDYMKFANLREMHQPSAVGVVPDAKVDDKGLYIRGRVVDADAWEKVVEGVYKGFSVGGKVTQRDDREQHVITGLDLMEISLVDRPANPEAVIEFYKRADGAQPKGITMLTNDQVFAKAVELAKAAGRESDAGDYINAARAELEKSDAKPAVAAPEDADPAKAIKAASAKLSQKWVTSDGKHFEKRDEAAKHEATISPSAAFNDALGGLKAALGKSTFTESSSPTEGLTSYDLEGEATNEGAGENVTLPAHDKVEANSQATTEAPGGMSAQNKAKAKAKAKPAEEEDDDPEEPPEDKEAEKRAFSDKERAAAAESGAAQPDGSFPIENKKDLANAIRAYGRAKNKAKIKAHIIARAKALGATSLLPKGWADGEKRSKADIADDLRKDMFTVSRFACLIQELEWLHEAVEMEQVREGDDSAQPADIKENIARLCATLRSMVDEETEELLNDEEMDDFGDLLELAASPLQAGNANALLKVVRGARLAKASSSVLARLPMFITELEKVGRRHNRGDMAHIQKMHDSSVALGAKCAPSNDDTEKSGDTGDLAKVMAQNAALERQLAEAVPILKTMSALVTKIAEQPAVIPASRMSVIDKSADVARELDRLGSQPPGVTAFELIKHSINNPQPLRTGE